MKTVRFNHHITIIDGTDLKNEMPRLFPTNISTSVGNKILESLLSVCAFPSELRSLLCCENYILITIHCPLIENIIVMPPKLTFDRVIGAIEDVIITEEFQVQKRNKMNSDLMKLKILLPSST